MLRITALILAAGILASCSIVNYTGVRQDKDGTVIIWGSQTKGLSGGVDGVVYECKDTGAQLDCRRTNASDVISTF